MVCNSFHILDTARTVFTTETISVRPVFRSINFSSMVPAHITLMTVEPASTSSPASPARRLPQPRHWLRLQEQAGKWKSGTWSFWFLFTFHPYVTVTSHKVSPKFTPQPKVPLCPLCPSQVLPPWPAPSYWRPSLRHPRFHFPDPLLSSSNSCSWSFSCLLQEWAGAFQTIGIIWLSLRSTCAFGFLLLI